MKILFNAALAISLVFASFSCLNADSEALESSEVYHAAAKFSVEKEYKGELQIVLGDVKQAFITDKLSTKKQIEMLVKGFKYEFKVDGIRIPIFPEGHMSKQQRFLMHYLMAKCKAEKLLVFANPANHLGGVRIANGDMSNTSSVKGDFAKSDKLIQVVRDFSKEYNVDFISPLNEDSAPGDAWTAEQINDIYASLYGKVQGAKLVGSDVWGIPAAIKYLDQTNIADYIDVSTTHNLGFNHDKWPEFIEKSGHLPVWDSEVNMNKKYANRLTRIEAAIERGVNGLVLYNSWNMINLETGEIGANGMKFRDYYLK
ncbi:hypothetical protein GCM10007049_01120 [Echinicola pacifica]|uniref:Glycosyl hydrolase domain-containing protein n=1 Tax=Echinicola pacifica TaxID=346377 RepID=A0A918UIX8_9BACT|nr:hypothetical protein [Echinicola pacifica]GGZ13127.1 hypothetical protein GCM10007049_01120 [Echinicola pacifica]